MSYGKRQKWIGQSFKVSHNLEWGATEFNLVATSFSVKIDSMIELKYEPAIQNLQKLFTCWNKRYLMPLGIIQ